MTNQGTSPQLLFSSDDGFASSNRSRPLIHRLGDGLRDDYTGGCEFTDLGGGGTYPSRPCPGTTAASSTSASGARAGRVELVQRLLRRRRKRDRRRSGADTGGAQVYSLGESNCQGDTVETCFDPPLGGPAGVEQGKPATFMFGFVTTIGDLSITKADSPDPVFVDGELTYTITVDNNGPQAAAGVQVTDELPADVEFVSATPDQGSCTGTSTVTCSLGSIALDGGAEITIVVRPTSTTPDLSNTATVTSTSSDANPANDSATSHTQVIPEDTTPPETTIDSGPAAARRPRTTTPRSPSAPTSRARRFECKLDAGAPFAPCTPTPKDYTDLADGSHTFSVRAIDAGRQRRSDPGEPHLDDRHRRRRTPRSTPAPPAARRPTNNDPVVHLQLRRAGLDASSASSTPAPSRPAPAPKRPTPEPRRRLAHLLGPGDRPGRQRRSDARRAAPGRSTPTPPETTIDSGPADGSTTNDNDPDVHLQLRRAGLDASSASSTPAPSRPARRRRTYTDLADGPHTFSVRAIDAAGNVDPTPATPHLDGRHRRAGHHDRPGPAGGSTTTTTTPRSPSPPSEPGVDASSASSTPAPSRPAPRRRTTPTSPTARTPSRSGRSSRPATSIRPRRAAPGRSTPTRRIRRSTPAPPAARRPRTTTPRSPSAPTSRARRFECKLDAGAFAPCTTPKDYTDLADG